MDTDLKDWPSTAGAAERLGVTMERIRQLRLERKVRFVETAAGPLFDPESLDEYAANRTIGRPRKQAESA